MDAIQFTPLDLASVNLALDSTLNEARSRRLFTAFMKATRGGDNPIDLAWALAQALHNVICQQAADEQTELLRTFIAMVLLVGARHREQETKH
jgi:hypothetical protein